MKLHRVQMFCVCPAAKMGQTNFASGQGVTHFLQLLTISSCAHVALQLLHRDTPRCSSRSPICGHEGITHRTATLRRSRASSPLGNVGTTLNATPPRTCALSYLLKKILYDLGKTARVAYM